MYLVIRIFIRVMFILSFVRNDWFCGFYCFFVEEILIFIGLLLFELI